MLCPRVPHPPHRSDTTASYHLLRYLGQRHRVHLGTFLTDTQDDADSQVVSAMCASTWFGTISRSTSLLRMTAGYLRGEPIETARFRDPELKRWLKRTIKASRCKHLIVHGSGAARSIPSKFLLDKSNSLVADFDDFDPELWTYKGSQLSFPLSLFYRNEAEKQVSFDRRLAMRARAPIVRSAAQAKSFLDRAPEITPKLAIVTRGIDRVHYSRDSSRVNPYRDDELPIVMTGFFSNLSSIDAANWFVIEVLPLIRKRVPTARLYIVGDSVGSEIRNLASAAVVVISDAADDRAYIQYAKIAVAPNQIGAGSANEAFKAMSMGRPLIASEIIAAELVPALEGEEFLLADEVEKMADLAVRVLVQPDIGEAVGANARLRIEQDFDWDRSLAKIENLLLGRNI